MLMKILLHLVGAFQFSYSVYYDWTYVHVPREISNGSKFGGKFIFLTFWDAIIQAVFFWICLLNDCFGSNDFYPKQLPAIRKIKDKLFCTIAFPLSVFVAVTFWGLYAIDRELVLPKVLDLYFPNWLNHIMHTYILIFSLIELVTSFRQYPTRREGLTTLTIFMLIYLIWTFIIYAKSGEWVYPVMEVLSWPQRTAFFAGLLLLVLSFYLLGEFLNKLIWKSELKKFNGFKQVNKKKIH